MVAFDAVINSILWGLIVFEVYIKQSFLMVLLFSGIPLVTSSVVGLIVAVLQSATQIQEQSLVYLVKFITISTVFGVLGGWYASELVNYFQELIRSLYAMGKL